MAQSNTSRGEVPRFLFNVEHQAAAWREFYTRALDYMETLHIDMEAEDDNKREWKPIKIMFTGEDRQALQTLIYNNTITPEDQCTSIRALKAIQTTIEEEEHYWHYRDEVMSDIRQHPGKQVHALNTRITTLVNNCSFQDPQTTETIKIMLLQHAIRYHEACQLGSAYKTQQHSLTKHSYNTANYWINIASNLERHKKRVKQN